MIILPAIDLKDGKVVRLYQGDFSTAHQVAEDPLTTAQAFAQAGARWLHMVDLDGAREGKRLNSDHIRQVVQASSLRVELGGGIRIRADVDAAAQLGVSRMVIGSAAVTDPGVVDYALERYGAGVAVGIDCLDVGRELARRMEEKGVKTLVFTDIATDGMLSGPSFDQLAALQKAVGCQIVASGGVTTLDDVKRLRDMGLYGAIIGKAYYAGTIDLAEAIREAGPQQ